MASDDVFTDMLAAAAEAHRANEVHSRLDDYLVEGRLLLTEAALEQLKRDTTVADASPGWGPNPVALPPWALIPVLTIPDDGAPHDVGGGKVAIVNPYDHRTILVFPADLLDPPRECNDCGCDHAGGDCISD